MQTTQSPQTASATLLSWPALKALVPLSRATVFGLRRQGKFPEPIRISEGRVAWRHADVVAWIEERAQASIR